MSTKNQELSLMDLFKVGAHRGNKKSRSNPRLKSKVYGTSQGLTLIDLAESIKSIEEAEKFLYKIGRGRKQILVVGTSKHLQDLTKKHAENWAGKEMPYVNHRWLGGTLTNWSTIKKTLKHLAKNESIIANEKFFDELSRNEQLAITRETEKMKKVFDGLKNLKFNKPAAIIVLDAEENPVAIREAETMGVPVITFANTGTKYLPENLKYTIICNNNSTKLIETLLGRFAKAYEDGLASVALDTKEEEKEKVKK